MVVAKLGFWTKETGTLDCLNYDFTYFKPPLYCLQTLSFLPYISLCKIFSKSHLVFQRLSFAIFCNNCDNGYDIFSQFSFALSKKCVSLWRI